MHTGRGEESVIKHLCTFIWTPVIGEELTCIIKSVECVLCDDSTVVGDYSAPSQLVFVSWWNNNA